MKQQLRSKMVNIRFERQSYERISELADELGLDRGQLVRALVEPVIGTGTPAIKNLGELIRKTAREFSSETASAA